MFMRFIAAVLALMMVMTPVASMEESQFELAGEELIPIEDGDVVSSEFEAPVEEVVFELGDDDVVSEESNEFETDIVDKAYMAPSTGDIAISSANFPDTAFRSYISQSFDLGGSGSLSQSEISQVYEVDVEDMGIASLQGIEYFSALEYLNCRDNLLTTLDLSGNPNISCLHCSGNQISQIDFSNNPQLQDIVNSYGPVRYSQEITSFINPNAHDDVDSNLSIDTSIVITANGATIYSPSMNIVRDVGTVVIGKGETVYGIQCEDPWIPEWIRPLYPTKIETSNKKIVSVEKNGNIKGKKEGTARITAVASNGLGVTYAVVVKKAPSKVELPKSITLGEDDIISFSAVLPSGSASHELTWTTTNEDVAECGNYWGEQQLRTGVPGKATITVKTFNKKTASCVVSVVATPQSISLPEKTIGIGVGQTYTVEPVFKPTGAGGSITCKSSNSSAVSVNGNILTAQKAGKATITVKTYNGCKATATVTVVAAPTSVSLENTSLMLGEGEVYPLSPSVPAGSYASYTFTSSKPKVASVSEDGSITAIKSGSAKITVKTYNGKTAVCNVTVAKKPTGIKLSESAVTLGTNQVFEPSVTLSPSKCGGTLTWTSSDEKVVSTAGGKLTAVGLGKATLTVKTYNGLSDSCVVTVKKGPDAVSLTQKTITLSEGMTQTLDWKITGGGEGDDPCAFSSSNTKAVTVSNTGTLTAKKTGTATITIKTWNGLTDTCTVKVVGAPSKLTLNKAKAALGADDDLTLTYTLKPADALTTVTWTSSNEAVATVDQNGLVHAVAKGSATITAMTSNKKKGTCKLTVKAAAVTPTPAPTATAAPTPTPSPVDTGLDDFVIANGVLKQYTGAGGDVVIPSKDKNGNPVTEIDYRAFYECETLISITIPDSVVTIRDGNPYEEFENFGAFAGCTSLKSVTIPDSVTSIGSYTFCRCTSLKDVTLPRHLTSIEDSLFWKCSNLIFVSIPDTVKRIENSAFDQCSKLLIF